MECGQESRFGASTLHTHESLLVLHNEGVEPADEGKHWEAFYEGLIECGEDSANYPKRVSVYTVFH